VAIGDATNHTAKERHRL